MKLHKATEILPKIPGCYFCYIRNTKELLSFTSEGKFMLPDPNGLDEYEMNKSDISWIDESDVLPY